ncbi:MAG TPA: GNAT family N-acetyltransferase [Candidatus Krumholzibacteria bacterium]|nr:GNAT family N-acetyltransferase [Candidatus Krumholzibacteria bacterium]
MNITVRDAIPADIEAIVGYNQRLAGETEGKSLDPAVIGAGVRRGFACPQMCRYFVAEADGRVIGTTMLTYELTDWRDGVIWWLQSVFIEPEFRRHGVFRAIYRHIETLARQSADVRGLRLYVHRDNGRAMQTYEALGMEKAGYELYEHDWSASVHPVDE